MNRNLNATGKGAHDPNVLFGDTRSMLGNRPAT